MTRIPALCAALMLLACSKPTPPAAAPAAPTTVQPAVDPALAVLNDPTAKTLAIMAAPPSDTVFDNVQVAPGVSLRVLRRGAGRPIVMVPGWTCTADFFSHQLSGLGEDHQVIAYDPRGHGGSDKPLHGNTIRQRGADLHALFEHYDLEDAVIVGWSFGIHDMFAYLRDHGTDKVSGVVVLDEPPKAWVDPAAPQAWGEIPLAENGIVFFLRSVIDDRRSFWSGYAGYMLGMDPDAAANSPDVQRIVDLGMLTPDAVALASMADGAASDFTDVARTVSETTPMMVLARADWADAAQTWTKAELPKAAFEKVTTHMSFATDPDTVNTVLGDFVGSLP